MGVVGHPQHKHEQHGHKVNAATQRSAQQHDGYVPPRGFRQTCASHTQCLSSAPVLRATSHQHTTTSMTPTPQRIQGCQRCANVGLRQRSQVRKRHRDIHQRASCMWKLRKVATTSCQRRRRRPTHPKAHVLSPLQESQTRHGYQIAGKRVRSDRAAMLIQLHHTMRFWLRYRQTTRRWAPGKHSWCTLPGMTPTSKATTR